MLGFLALVRLSNLSYEYPDEKGYISNMNILPFQNQLLK